MNRDDRQRVALCLEIAFEIVDLFESGGEEARVFGFAGRSIHVDRIKEVVQLHITRNLTEKELERLNKMIAHNFTEHGLSTCAAWELGHDLEHILWPRKD